jgi:hypothetical protein
MTLFEGGSRCQTKSLRRVRSLERSPFHHFRSWKVQRFRGSEVEQKAQKAEKAEKFRISEGPGCRSSEFQKFEGFGVQKLRRPAEASS